MKVTVGEEYVLPVVESVRIQSDMGTLSDTAVVRLPRYHYRREIRYPDVMRAGARCDVELGYDGRLRKEFEGWIHNVRVSQDSVELELEDWMYKLRFVTVPNGVLERPKTEAIVKHCLTNADGVSYDCSKGVTVFDKFYFQDCTAYQGLSKLQEEGFVDVYFDGRELKVKTPGQTRANSWEVDYLNSPRYDWGRNIDREGLSLEFRTELEPPVRVVCFGKDRQGNEHSASVGPAHGDVISHHVRGYPSDEHLKWVAENIYAQHAYTGYSGSFRSWLEPYVKVGGVVRLPRYVDPWNPGTEAVYLVTGVETSVDASGGGVRNITLGRSFPINGNGNVEYSYVRDYFKYDKE